MLAELGFAVCGPADTARRAVELALSQRPRLVLMDIRLKGRPDGIDAAREIRAQLPVPIIFVTGSCEREMMLRMEAVEAAGVLIKPILFAELKAAIDKALEPPS